MAEKESEPEDPFTLTGMVLPMRRDQAEAAETAMAECFIEEYMRLGYGDAEILALFENPFYCATNVVYRARGAKFVSDLIGSLRCGEHPAPMSGREN